ncbi:MAG: thymidylate kinase [Candidatus Taylorbacteria bacterium]
MKKGKLIVIEGTDGSGKATQVALLLKRLKKEGKKVSALDFPRYEKPSSYFVGKYLRGEYGKVGPYKASLFYALDRYDASFEIKKKLEQGYTVLSDRYVSANMGHQGSKISNRKKREHFLRWLDNLEYEIFGIPRPSLTILLNIPPLLGQKLVDGKKRRAYLGKRKRDIHEDDIGHLKKTSMMYLSLARKYRWTVINCTSGDTLLSREFIHEKIFQEVKKLLP